MAHLQPRQQLPPAPARPERRGGGEVRTRGHVARARLAVLNGGVEDEACGWGRLTAARAHHRQQAARRVAEEKHGDGTAVAAGAPPAAAVARVTGNAALDTGAAIGSGDLRSSSAASDTDAISRLRAAAATPRPRAQPRATDSTGGGLPRRSSSSEKESDT